MILKLYSLQALITCILSFVIGLYVFSKDKHSSINRTFFLWTFSVAIWAFGISRHTLASSTTSGLLWSRILHGSAVFIPTFFLHFTFSLLHIKKRIWILKLSYLGSIILFIFNFTNLFIPGVRKILYFEYFPSAGPIYPIFVIMFSLCVIYALYSMFKALTISSGIRKNQLKYLFLGAAIGFSGGSTTFFPVFNIKVFPIGNFFIFLYISLIAYAIVRHRLMNIGLVYRGGLVFVLYLVCILSIFIPPILLLRHSLMWLSLVVIFLSCVSPFIYKFITTLFRPIFYGRKFAYIDKLGKDIDSTKPVYTSADVAERMVKGITSAMDVENCSFMMFNSWRSQFRPRAHIGLDGILGDYQIMPKVVWEPDDPIVKLLESRKKILIKEEVAANPKKGYASILDSMTKIKAEITLPVFVESKLIGILSIGRKLSGDMYDTTDLNLLDAVVKTAERDLLHTYFMEERTVFSSKVAHDLRSPLNWVSNDLSNLNEGVYGTLNEEQRQTVHNISESLRIHERNIRQFFDLNVISQRVVQGQYELKPLNIKEVIEKQVEKFNASAERKGIELVAELPSKIPVIMVMANKEGIERVFENLITNALKYTKKGKIVVGADMGVGGIICKVEDTGVGIPEHCIPHVFKAFFHLHSAGEDKHTGVGLGLVIVKETVEANKGRVWVESKEGKGTTFYFSLSFAE